MRGRPYNSHEVVIVGALHCTKLVPGSLCTMRTAPQEKSMPNMNLQFVNS